MATPVNLPSPGDPFEPTQMDVSASVPTPPPMGPLEMADAWNHHWATVDRLYDAMFAWSLGWRPR